MISQITPVVPVYLVIDVSYSMTQNMGEVNEAIRSAVLDTDPLAANRVHLAVISFSDKAQVVLPLTPIGDIPTPPVLSVQGGTSYGPVLRTLRETIVVDVEHLKRGGYSVARPIAFFLTDGAPQDSWAQDHKALIENKYHPTLLAFGIANADPVVLAGLASIPGLAFMARSQVDKNVTIASYGEAVQNYFRGLSGSTQAGIPEVAVSVNSNFSAVPYDEDWV